MSMGGIFKTQKFYNMNTPEIIEQRLADVKRMRDNLARSANLRNLVVEDLETQQQLIQGLKKVPTSTVIDQAQQLEHQILPALEKKYGITHEQYTYWKGVLDSLNWLLHVMDYLERLERRLMRVQHQLKYYQDLAVKLEQELQHYTTVERYLTIDLLNKAMKDA